MLLPRIILAVVPKSAAANGVDDDEEYEEDDVDYGHLLPVTLYVIEHPSLARLAVIAQHARVVSPRAAFWIGLGRAPSLRPIGRGHIREVARVCRL